MVIWELSWDFYEKSKQDNNHNILNISLTYSNKSKETVPVTVVVHAGIVVRE